MLTHAGLGAQRLELRELGASARELILKTREAWVRLGYGLIDILPAPNNPRCNPKPNPNPNPKPNVADCCHGVVRASQGGYANEAKACGTRGC